MRCSISEVDGVGGVWLRYGAPIMHMMPCHNFARHWHVEWWHGMGEATLISLSLVVCYDGFLRL